MIDTFDSASLACGNGTASAASRTPGLAGLGLAIHAAPHHSWAGETPWHVVANDDALELRVGRRRKEAQSDADCASVLMGCGAALENMRIALNHAGFLPDVALFQIGRAHV